MEYLCWYNNNVHIIKDIPKKIDIYTTTEIWEHPHSKRDVKIVNKKYFENDSKYVVEDKYEFEKTEYGYTVYDWVLQEQSFVAVENTPVVNRNLLSQNTLEDLIDGSIIELYTK